MQADKTTFTKRLARQSRPGRQQATGGQAEFELALAGLFEPHLEQRYCPACQRHTLHERLVPRLAAVSLCWGLLAASLAAGVIGATLVEGWLGATLFVGLVGLGCKFALPAVAARYLHTCRSCHATRKRSQATNRCVAARSRCQAQSASCGSTAGRE